MADELGLTQIEAVVAPVLQKYMMEFPFVLSKILSPLQILVSRIVSITGKGRMVTITESKLKQGLLPICPLTEYFVVVCGVTKIVDIVSPVFHKYLFAVPITLKMTELPIQMAVSLFVVIMGKGLVLMLTVS